MIQEDKELLVKDICSRLPYGLKYNFDGYDICYYTMRSVSTDLVDNVFPIELVKPYLFPLSSMTKEQKTECFKGTSLELSKYDEIYGYSEYTDLGCYLKVIDWLNAHHFDFRGLIENELAIDATGLNIY